MCKSSNDLHPITIERSAETAEITIEPVRNYDRAHKTTTASGRDPGSAKNVTCPSFVESVCVGRIKLPAPARLEVGEDTWVRMELEFPLRGESTRQYWGASRADQRVPIPPLALGASPEQIVAETRESNDRSQSRFLTAVF